VYVHIYERGIKKEGNGEILKENFNFQVILIILYAGSCNFATLDSSNHPLNFVSLLSLSLPYLMLFLTLCKEEYYRISKVNLCLVEAAFINMDLQLLPCFDHLPSLSRSLPVYFDDRGSQLCMAVLMLG
jgi:hypothetical protein